MSDIKHNRNFMKCAIFSEGMKQSDQQAGLPNPPHGKKYEGEIIVLSDFWAGESKPYEKLLDTRRSVRTYDIETPMSQAKLAYLLFSCAGIQKFWGANNVATQRPVPSGGARHPFEVYIAVNNVQDMKQGLYHYRPAENVGEKKVSLTFIKNFEDYKKQTTDMLAGQVWAANASVILFISCIPYRGEWRYSALSHRVMLIDLGHLGQNVMLSATDMNMGSCCMAAYDQKACDDFIELNGEDEYMVYAIAVGNIKN